jgi:hypothetical protein
MTKSHNSKRSKKNSGVHGAVHSSATHGGVSFAIAGPNQAPINIVMPATTSSGTGTDQTQWEVTFVKGSTYHLMEGVAGTLDKLNGHHRECFSSDGTMILGTLDGTLMGKITLNRASWRIPVKPHFVRDYIRGFAAIGCLRYYGGLHSRQYDSKATISINGKPADRILLRIKPEGHSDYFCQIPKPEFWPNIPPFAECRTLYVWPLILENLVDSNWQSLEIEIDGFGNWDIDYVGLVFESAHRHGL